MPLKLLETLGGDCCKNTALYTRLANAIPATTPAKPVKTLNNRYSNAVTKNRSFNSPYISISNVENVVNAPRKPTIKAKRRLSLTSTLSVSRISKNPIKNEPVTFMRKVGRESAQKDLQAARC